MIIKQLSSLYSVYTLQYCRVCFFCIIKLISFFFLAGHHKCRENWPENSEKFERTFNLFLDVILLVIPLLMLGATYSLITKTLWQDMRTENFGGSEMMATKRMDSCKYKSNIFSNSRYRKVPQGKYLKQLF